MLHSFQTSIVLLYIVKSSETLKENTKINGNKFIITVSGSIRDVWSEADASLYKKVTGGVLSEVELNLN